MFSTEQNGGRMHWCRRCSFHGLTSVTVQSGRVLSDIITHIIITIIPTPQCSFSSIKCGLVADKKNHHHSHKTAPIYTVYATKPPSKITYRAALQYSWKPCWCDFVDNAISGTFIWNNWSHVQFVLNCNKHFRFLLDKYSLLSKESNLFNIFLLSHLLPISNCFQTSVKEWEKHTEG